MNFYDANVIEKAQSIPNAKELIDVYNQHFKQLECKFDAYKAKCKELGINVKDFTMILRIAICGRSQTIVDLFLAMNLLKEKYGPQEIDNRISFFSGMLNEKLP
jgi:hypothetical protein